MSDRPSALLTNTHRDYVMDRSERDNATNARKLRERLRDRVFTGLEQDGKILAELDDDLRRGIFRAWENRNYENHPSGIDIPKSEPVMGDDVEKMQLRFGIQGLLQFIYLGVEESDVGDFFELVDEAIDSAVRDQGLYVEDSTHDIEFGELATIEDVHQMLESGELDFDDLTIGEVGALIESGEMDPEDFPQDFLKDIVEMIEDMEALHEKFLGDGR